jgi:hypothetical protein
MILELKSRMFFVIPPLFINSPASMKRSIASSEKLFTFAKSFCGISIRGILPEKIIYVTEDNPIAANMGRPLISKSRKTINIITIGLKIFPLFSFFP